MKEIRLIMGMPVVVEIVGAPREALEPIFSYFQSVDERFSTYKPSSEISRINRGEIAPGAYSDEMDEILRLAEETKRLTHGYFDIRTPDGPLDPSGIVKGWAIRNAAKIAYTAGHRDYWIEAGGDIEISGNNAHGEAWRVGIRNPFDDTKIVKVLRPGEGGVATSGDYVRGHHIYDPHTYAPVSSPLASISVIGTDVYEADRFATAAFAMGDRGINFIESLDGFEAYAIAKDSRATMTSNLYKYAV